MFLSKQLVKQHSSLLTAWKKNACLLAEINFIWIRGCYLILHACSNIESWTCRLTERSSSEHASFQKISDMVTGCSPKKNFFPIFFKVADFPFPALITELLSHIIQ